MYINNDRLNTKINALQQTKLTVLTLLLFDLLILTYFSSFVLQS